MSDAQVGYQWGRALVTEFSWRSSVILIPEKVNIVLQPLCPNGTELFHLHLIRRYVTPAVMRCLHDEHLAILPPT